MSLARSASGRLHEVGIASSVLQLRWLFFSCLASIVISGDTALCTITREHTTGIGPKKGLPSEAPVRFCS